MVAGIVSSSSTCLQAVKDRQGKRQDAYELLAPVYDWFTEGFDTKDLLDAKAPARRTGVAKHPTVTRVFA